MRLKRIISLALLTLLVSFYASADDFCDGIYKGAIRDYEKSEYKKSLQAFEYIQNSRCSSYYDVSNWIKKCKTAINQEKEKSKAKAKETENTDEQPKQNNASKENKVNKKHTYFNIPDTTITVPFTDTTVNIVIKSNSQWQVELAFEDWYNATRIDDTLSIYVERNTFEVIRHAEFIIRAANDKSKVVTFTLIQQAAEKYIDVSDNNIVVQGNKGEQTIDVLTSMPHWEIIYFPDWIKCEKTNANKSILIKIEENPLNTARHDSIIVRAENLIKVININQKTLAPSPEQLAIMKAQIKSVSASDNSYRNGTMGVLIHTNLVLEHMNGVKTKVLIRFADKEHNLLKSKIKDEQYTDNEKNVIAFQQFIPFKQQYSIEDYIIHMPYSRLTKQGIIAYQVEIQESFTGTILATSQWNTFVHGIAAIPNTLRFADTGGTDDITIKSNVEWYVDSIEKNILAVRKGDILNVTAQPHTYINEISSKIYLIDKSKVFHDTITVYQDKFDPLKKINTGIDIIHVNADKVRIGQKDIFEIIVTCDQKWKIVNPYPDFLSAKQKKNVVIVRRGNETRSHDLTSLYFDIVTEDGKVLRIPVYIEGRK